MKKIFTYFGIFLSVVLMASLSSCQTKELDQPEDLGLNIKVFSPTKVVKGQPMTINGSGFGDVKEIIFPNAVSVTDFEIVSNEMIRVVAPSGISAEGGKLIVRTDKEQVESPLPLTLGSTSISGYSKQEGEEVEGGSQLTIFGKDLEFIYAVELLNSEGAPNLITHENFYRKGTSSVVITVPKIDIYEGSFKGVVYTYDEKSFEMPEFVYKPGGGGHWEIKKVMMWENGGTVTDPENWNGTYRYALEGHNGGKEAVAEIPQENWDIIKTGTFYLTISPAADWYQVRVVTGWWNAQWPEADSGGAFDFNTNSEEWIDNEDGTFTLPITFGDHEIVGLIDEQHLLFTGGGFIVENLYYEKEEWVEGEEGHWETQITSFWKGDGKTDPANWNGTYRYALEGRDTNPDGKECIAEISPENWNKIKTETFYLKVKPTADWFQVRIVTGWWNAQWPQADSGGAFDFNPNSPEWIVNEDGTYTLPITFGDHEIVGLLDEQHLLFTGGSFIVLELFQQEEVWVEGEGTPKEIVLSTETFDCHGNPQPKVVPEHKMSEVGAKAGQKMRFYITADNGFWCQIVSGWWSPIGTDYFGTFDGNYDLEGHNGAMEIVLDDTAIAAFEEQGIIINADGIVISKITIE